MLGSTPNGAGSSWERGAEAACAPLRSSESCHLSASRAVEDMTKRAKSHTDLTEPWPHCVMVCVCLLSNATRYASPVCVVLQYAYVLRVCCNGLPARTQDPAHQLSHSSKGGPCFEMAQLPF